MQHVYKQAFPNMLPAMKSNEYKIVNNHLTLSTSQSKKFINLTPEYLIYCIVKREGRSRTATKVNEFKTLQC